MSVLWKQEDKSQKKKEKVKKKKDNNERHSPLLRFTSLPQKAGIKSLGPGLFIHSRGKLRGIS